MVERDAAAWVGILYDKLVRRRRRLEKWDRYYRGDHPMPGSDRELRPEMLHLLRKSRTNHVRQVVNVPASRMVVVGFRAANANDTLAWQLWQQNRLDRHHKTSIRDALKYGVAPISVWKDDAGVSIVPESPFETIVGYDRSPIRRQRAAALKVWTEEPARTGDEPVLHAVLWLPESVSYWSRLKDSSGPWMADGDAMPNPLGAVPVVELVADPQTDGTGESLMEPVIDCQDRVNELTLMMMLGARYDAYKQRWAAGVPMQHDEMGQAILPWDPGQDSVWVSTNPDTKFGEFGASDLRQYLEARNDAIHDLYTTAEVAPTHLLGSLKGVSAEGLAVADALMVANISGQFCPAIGEGLEEVMGLALAAAGDPRADDEATEVVWKDPHHQSLAELLDAAVKAKSVGASQEYLLERFLGMSPTEIEIERARATQQQMVDAMAAAVAAPPTPPTTPAPAEPVV